MAAPARHPLGPDRGARGATRARSTRSRSSRSTRSSRDSSHRCPAGPGPASDRWIRGRDARSSSSTASNDPATGERLLSADQLGGLQASGGRARAVQLEDRYVDTRDGALARAGFAVRLRQQGADTIVTVKSLVATHHDDGAVEREELEGPADRVAAAADWPASDARALVLEHAGDAPLVERVTIRQLRHKRQLRVWLARVELSLDEVDVVSRGRIVRSFTELEAELVKGDAALLGDLARRLDTESGLVRSEGSKLEAALAAVEGSNGDGGSLEGDGAAPAPRVAEAGPAPDSVDSPGMPRLVVGKTPGVLAEDSVAEAGRKVMRFHLARMLDREPGVRSGIDAEDVHKMRVATRRQRAAWRVFGESYRKNRTKPYRSGLRDIAHRLGAVRDLDVQLEGADRLSGGSPSGGAARGRAAYQRLATASGRCAGPLAARARLTRLRAVDRRLRGFRPHGRRRGGPGQPGGAAPGA